MPMMKCPECNKEYSDQAVLCPQCGHPNPNAVQPQAVIQERYKGTFSAGRLAIGIVSMVLTLIILLQSCAAGFVNTVQENGSNSGSVGFLVAICFLVGGIVGVATRNSRGKGGAITSGVFYLVSGIMAVAGAGNYKDLMIWGVLGIGFGVFYVVAGVKKRK